MSDVRQIARERLSRERGYIQKDWGGRIPVAVVYPNSYYIGMSNLALQTVYGLFNAYPDFVCERAFVDPPGRDQREFPMVVSNACRSVNTHRFPGSINRTPGVRDPRSSSMHIPPSRL